VLHASRCNPLAARTCLRLTDAPRDPAAHLDDPKISAAADSSRLSPRNANDISKHSAPSPSCWASPEFPGRIVEKRGRHESSHRSQSNRRVYRRFQRVASLARSAPPEGDGVVFVRSAYGFDETIERLKADIVRKKIILFDAIDQTRLASGAGIELRPSTLIVFGNPPLGVQFLTSNPAAGLDWPVRLLVTEVAKGRCL
jgi:hypothetical protein